MVDIGLSMQGWNQLRFNWSSVFFIDLKKFGEFPVKKIVNKKKPEKIGSVYTGFPAVGKRVLLFFFKSDLKMVILFEKRSDF